MLEMALQVFVFVTHAFLTFKVQRKGTARTEGMNYAHKVLGEKSPNKKNARRKRQKDVKPSDQLCLLGEREKEIKEEIFNSLYRLP